MSPIERCGSPESMYLTGQRRENPSLKGRVSADVVGVFSFKRSTKQKNYGSFSLLTKV